MAQAIEELVAGQAPSTKSARTFIERLTDRKSVLVVLPREDVTAWKSVNNLANVHTLSQDQLNTYDVLKADDVVFAVQAVLDLEEKAGVTAADALPFFVSTSDAIVDGQSAGIGVTRQVRDALLASSKSSGKKIWGNMPFGLDPTPADIWRTSYVASTNPFQVFLADLHAPEVWKGSALISGGKHYGHMEVNVTSDNGSWQAELTPAYVFPLMSETGKVVGWERRTYDDVVILHQ